MLDILKETFKNDSEISVEDLERFTKSINNIPALNLVDDNVMEEDNTWTA